MEAIMVLLIVWGAGWIAFRFVRGVLRLLTPAPPPTIRREPIPAHVKREVWRRDQGRCVYCGSQAFLEYDHIVPVSLGGKSTVRNLQLLCERCNRSKSNKVW